MVVAGSDGQIRGLRAADGSPVWHIDANAGLGASPAIQRGRVFIPTLGGHLMALRLGDGTRIWDRSLGGQNYGSPALSGGSLILATGFPTQKVVRVDMTTGDLQWETAPGVVAGLANSSPAIDGGQVVFGMNNGRYQSVDLATGAASWTIDTQGLVNLSAPLLVGQSAYFVPGGRSAAVYAVDRAAGTLLPGWPVAISDPDAPEAKSIVNVRHAVSSPTIAGRLVVFQIRFEYAVTAGSLGPDVSHALREYVVAVDPTARAIAWQRQVGTRLASNVNQIPELGLCPTPAVFMTAAGPAVAAASSVAAIIRVLDGTSGAELWMSTMVAPTRSSPVLANGQLFVGTENGMLQAYASEANHAPAAPASGFVPASGATLDGARPVLRWAAAEDRDGSPVSYQVRIDSDGELLETWMAELTTAAGDTQVAVPKGLLRSGANYVFAVRGRDAAGAFSGWSAPQSFTAALTPWIEVAGSTYDTLEEAVAAAPPGATIHVGRGVLHLASSIRLPAGSSLIGAGPHETVLDAAGLASGITMGGVHPGAASDTVKGPAEVKGVTIAGAWVGVKVTESKENVLRNVVVRDNVRSGIEVETGAVAELINATVVRNGTGAASGGTLSVRNCIISDNEVGLSRRGEGMLTSRYNNLFANRTVNYEGAEPGVGDISTAVLFPGEARHDYRLTALQSTTDRGDPADDFSLEPAPNGGRVNLGAYGNTPQAEPSGLELTWKDQVSTAAANGCSFGGYGEPPIGGSILTALGAVYIAKRRSRLLPMQTRRKRRVRWLIFKAVVFATLLSSPAFAMSRVQTVTGSNKEDSTVKATWPADTRTGNLLVAVLGFRGGSSVTVTPPSGKGWTLATRANGSDISTAIYYSANATSQSGTSTWSLSPSSHATLTLVEYIGAQPTTVLDKTATATGSSSTASFGTTAATTQASEVAIAAVSVAGTATYTVASGGFSEVSEIASTTESPGDRNNTMFAERMLTATAAQTGTATLSASSAWAGAIATFKTGIRYWVGSTSDCAASGNWSLSSGGSSSGVGAPETSSIVVFDGNDTTSCTLSSSLSLYSAEVRSGYTGTVTIGSGATLSTTGPVSVAAGNVSGVATVGGAFTMTGGTWDTNGGSMTVSGAGQITGGTFKVGTGTQTMSGGLTVASGGSLDLSGAGGKLQLGSGTTLTLNGTLTASGSGTTVPRIQSSSGNYTFTVGSTATLNINGLRIDNTDANGMNVSNATFRTFQNVQFRNNAGGTSSIHLQITATALDLYAPGCYFDGTATYNVKLTGNGTSDGQTRASFEYRNTATNGAHGGESYDLDDDNSPRDGIGDNPTTNGSSIQWLYSVVSDTAGTIEGFPAAAFDWNTFTWYGVYVAYRDTSGTGTTDRVYVRSMDGDPAYSYDIPESAGNILGTPRWDVVNETTVGMDVNGDGDATDTDVRIVYIPTTAGRIYKLIDTGTALTLPSSGSTWATPFTDTRVVSITSPLIADGTNLYFGGLDNSATPVPKVFGVQITKGSGEKTLVKSIVAASTVDVAPAWKIYNGSTYLFIGSQASAGQAYVYRMDVAPGASINASCLDPQHNVNGSVRLVADHAIVGDAGGRVHHISAATFTVGGFSNTSGFPFRDTANHTTTFLDAGSASIMNSPYIDPSTNYIYFGDKDGHLYVITSAGALLPGYPIRLTTTGQLSASPMYSSGVIMIGSNEGNVFYVDQKTDANAPNIFRTLSFGNVGISSISYNASRGEFMAATSTGQLFFISKLTDPTPSSN